MSISFRHKGSFKNTERFLKKAEKVGFLGTLNEYGKRGVEALASATPVKSGATANSWRYEIHSSPDDCAIYWVNDNIQDGWFNVAIGLQYGHGTRNGGWVEGIDYINPAIRPIFEEIAQAVWRDIKSW